MKRPRKDKHRPLLEGLSDASTRRFPRYAPDELDTWPEAERLAVVVRLMHGQLVHNGAMFWIINDYWPLDGAIRRILRSVPTESSRQVRALLVKLDRIGHRATHLESLDMTPAIEAALDRLAVRCHAIDLAYAAIHRRFRDDVETALRRLTRAPHRAPRRRAPA